MKPRILVLSGALAGSEFPLSQEPFTIGRDPASDLVIPDHTISRRHCVITFEGSEHYIEDTDSQNGTMLDARVITGKHRLRHGDRIGASSVTLAYLTREEDVSPQPPGYVDTENPLPNARSIPLERRTALLNIASAVAEASRSKPSVFLERLLDEIFNATPADRASVVFMDHEAMTIETVWGRDRRDPARPVRVSETIIKQVMRDGAEILSNDLAASGMDTIPSVRAAAVESILCVPLEIFGRRFGAIYADSFDPDARFDETHIELLSWIAVFAASIFQHISDLERLEAENAQLKEDLGVSQGLIGRSPAIAEVRRLIAKIAPTGSTVLIQGESGTGKELLARAIHANSERAGGPFITINCAAIPRELVESELFGHEKGSFTGATERKKGKFEAANGGTIFLDEVTEMPEDLQAKLLRVLQEGEIERVGGTGPIRVDVRVIAASNRDLPNTVASGEFRQDLYYRLNVITVTMPPLRDRLEDIPMLANHFIEKHRKKARRVVRGLSKEALAMLLNHDWPGNVRELQNAIERAMVIGETDLIIGEDFLSPDSFTGAAEPGSIHAELHAAKVRAYTRALIQADGDYKIACAILKVHERGFHRTVTSLGLDHLLKKRGEGDS